MPTVSSQKQWTLKVSWKFLGMFLLGLGAKLCLSTSIALGLIPRSSLSHKKKVAAVVAGGTGCAPANLEIEASLKQPKQP